MASAPLYGCGIDISEGGMSAYISMEIGVGKTMEMELILPYSQQPVKINAVVRNRRGFCYGIEFVNLAAPDREQILRSCNAFGMTKQAP